MRILMPASSLSWSGSHLNACMGLAAISVKHLCQHIAFTYLHRSVIIVIWCATGDVLALCLAM